MMLTRTSFPSNSSRIRLVKSRPFNARLYAHKYGTEIDGATACFDAAARLLFAFSETFSLREEENSSA